MTIAKKTAASKSEHESHGGVNVGSAADVAEEHYAQIQAQGVVPGSVSGGNGWGPPSGALSPTHAGVPPGWSSPGGPGSLSPRWSQTPGSSSRGDPEKRPAHGHASAPGGPPCYDYDEDFGPSTSKRRHRGGAGVSGGGGGGSGQSGLDRHCRGMRFGKRDYSSLVPRSAAAAAAVASPSSANAAPAITRPPLTPSPPNAQASPVGEGGYNSEDEYSHLGVTLTEEEWQEKDRRFERLMKRKGFVIKKMQEDGSCLFRAVADQIYGDEEMHVCVRNHCMDYIVSNADHFSMYITEDIGEYVRRKRYLGVHGNHLEIQALSEMYNRPIHIYCYSADPINIFQAVNGGGSDAAPDGRAIIHPIRLCYHREVHYNSLVDPHKATIGVGLGLPGYQPGAADRSLVQKGIRASEEDLVETAMLEDKMKATDWEATNEVIEEQVARESYMQWLRDNERRHAAADGGGPPAPPQPPAGRSAPASSSATVTSGELRSNTARHRSGGAAGQAPTTAQTTKASGANAALRPPAPPTSPGAASPPPPPAAPNACCSDAAPCSSPKAGCSTQLDRDSPKPGSSSSLHIQAAHADDDLGSGGFQMLETATFLNGLPPGMFGLEDWADTDVLTQVMAASQQEYLDSLKKQTSSPEPPPDAQPPAGEQRPGEPAAAVAGAADEN